MKAICNDHIKPVKYMKAICYDHIKRVKYMKAIYEGLQDSSELSDVIIM